jgi:hypothetical protein
MEVWTLPDSPTLNNPPRISMALPSPLDFGGTSIAESIDDYDGISDNTSILDDSDPKLGDPAFFDLKPPQSSASDVKLEEVVQRLFSQEHLHFIIADQALFYRFCIFVNRYKPQLAPTLVRYLEMRKAIKAIDYANAVARKIRWPSHTDHYKFSRLAAATTDVRFDDYASRELKLLCTEVLPAFITHSLVNFVVDCVARDITGEAGPVIQDLVGNLAEIFCLTDPSLPDNPIIYASEEFHRTTQYGTTYAIDRNCRFLQGPGTDKSCTARLREAISRGRESCETLLNYRRDGTPFVNLLMCAPLFDDKGQVRYFIGAQVDVSGLIEQGSGVESFRALLQSDRRNGEDSTNTYSPTDSGLGSDQSNGEPGENGTSNGHAKGQNNGYANGQANGYTNGHGVVNSTGKVKPASWSEAAKNQEMLARLRDLSMMFSQDEAEVIGRARDSRAAEEFRLQNTADPSADGQSIYEGRSVPKTRGQGKRLIGSDTGTGAFDLTQLSLNNTLPAPSLPGVYKNVSDVLSLIESICYSSECINILIIIVDVVYTDTSLSLPTNPLCVSFASHSRPPTHTPILQAGRLPAYPLLSLCRISRWCTFHRQDPLAS